jgi:hypothetical protein
VSEHDNAKCLYFNPQHLCLSLKVFIYFLFASLLKKLRSSNSTAFCQGGVCQSYPADVIQALEYILSFIIFTRQHFGPEGLQHISTAESPDVVCKLQ